MLIMRTTKYTSAVRRAVARLGHASNAQIIEQLRTDYPDISATTVHRVTSRLCESGELMLAPNMDDGSMRYDNNTTPHDHFRCNSCDRVRDLDIAHTFRPRIEKELGGCKVTGRLTISGSCESCINKKEE